MHFDLLSWGPVSQAAAHLIDRRDVNMKQFLNQIRHHPLSRRNKVEFSVYALIAGVSLGFIFLESSATKPAWWYSTIFMLTVLVALLRIASIFNADKGRIAVK